MSDDSTDAMAGTESKGRPEAAQRSLEDSPSPSPQMRTLLASFQTELEQVYRVEAPLSVTACLIDRQKWERNGGSNASEELLVREDGDVLEVGVYVDESVMGQLANGTGWTRQRLDAHCRALEGVSHFLYLSHRASMPRPVSLLELELQAEIDKFATLLLRFWARGRREMAGSLCELLFERVSYREGLSTEARERYEKANALARLYCRFLEAKYVLSGSVDGFFSDIRRMYRLGAGEKLSYAAQGAVI